MSPNPNLEFISKAVNNDLLIPKFPEFGEEIKVMFKECKLNQKG
jgi:hypothetical protein